MLLPTLIYEIAYEIAILILLPILHLSSPSPPLTATYLYPVIKGNWSESLPYIQSSIDLDPNYRYAYGYRGLLKHGLGWPRQALKDLGSARDTDSQVDPVVGSLSGVCYSCLGEERGMGRWVLVHFAVLYSYLCDFFIN
jgi:hypothetical protein